MTYQGWTNYETWNVVLWVTNTEEHYNSVMNYLVFAVTQQHKKSASNYLDGLAKNISRCFPIGTTPDMVAVTGKRCTVNWQEILDTSFKDIIEELETEWLNVLSALPSNPQGGFSGILEAQQKFREEHRYG